MTISPSHTSAPAGISPRAAASYALLDSLRIPYECVAHDPTATMEECEDVAALLGIRLCKNLFLCNRQQTVFYLLLMPGDKPFHTKDLSHQIGSSRLSFGSGEKMEELLGTLPGSASIMGLANDREHRVNLLIDKDLCDEEWFACHPCDNSCSLKIKTVDLFRVFLPYVGHEPTIVEL